MNENIDRNTLIDTVNKVKLLREKGASFDVEVVVIEYRDIDLGM